MRATRLDNLPPYLFAELEAKAAELKADGKDLIDLGIADPDLRPPFFLTDALTSHLDDPDSHQYPTSRGDTGVRVQVARWFKGRFGVKLDPEREIVITLGSKEGLADLARAVVNRGDKVAVPDPGYPVYAGAGAALNDAEAVTLRLDPDNGFLPDLKEAKGAKLVFLNYPNNPTGAMAPVEFYEEAGKWADDHAGQTLLAWDAAYSELAFTVHKTPSILQYTRNVVELHSLSKTMNATGYRIGFAVGHAETLAAMTQVKTQVDSGAPVFIQRAMGDALLRYNGAEPPGEMLFAFQKYARRKQMLEEGLKQVEGVKQVFSSPATFFVWAQVEDDMAFVDTWLAKGVILTPGRGFGEGGQGWVRASITTGDDRIEEALRRMGVK